MKYTEENPPLQCLLTNSTCYNGTYVMGEVKGVLWHSTGSANWDLKRFCQPTPGDNGYDYLINYLGKNYNGNDWNSSYVEAGVNAWIGKAANGEVTTVQALPWLYAPWGCGSGWRGSCNNGWIQFEICEPSTNLYDSNYFNAAYKEACELTAYLCVKFGIDPYGSHYVNGAQIPNILCHVDSYNLGMGTGHADVMHWFPIHGKSMDTVRNDVYNLIQNRNKEEEEVTQEQFNQMMNTYLSELATKPVDDWAKDAMNWAKNEGIYVGDGNSLMPRKFLTREEFAAVLQRVLEEGKGV